MRVALITLGSAGDLRPYLAIGAELVRRGCVVHLLGQAPYAELVEREGIRFLPIAGQREHDRTLRHPDLWHPIRGLGVLWRHLFVPAVESTYSQLQTLARAGDDQLIVLAHPLAVGARFFRENHPIRLLTGYTAPTSLRSSCDPMFVGSWLVPPIFPFTVRRALWRLLDAWKLEPMCRARIEQWQSQWQTPKISGSIFGEWLHSPDGGIAMFPRTFQEPCVDWPRRVHQFGFPTFAQSAPEPLSPEVLGFLEEGSAPLLLYGGSASSARHCHPFEALSRAAEAQGIRTITVDPNTHKNSHDHRSVPNRRVSLRVNWTDLAALLPRTNGFIHHGGIGSCADGLMAQVPQLIIASAFDQFQNGYCIQRMGAGHWLRATTITATSARQAIRQLAPSTPHISPVLPAARNQKSKLEASRTIAAICDHLIADQ